jgi:hypothetical protein
MILGKELKTIWILWLLLVNPTPGEAKPPVAEKHQRSFFCIMATSYPDCPGDTSFGTYN